MTGRLLTAAVPTLLYLCYGKQPIYDQAIYSILSLLHVSGGSPSDYRIVVYCDRAELFAALPVETVVMSLARLDEWLGGDTYIHRRKLCAIIDAMERYGGSVVFLDSDTYFKALPSRLFARVGPEQACLHIREGFVQATRTPADVALVRQLEHSDYRLPSGERVRITNRTAMWNTGVVGVHSADLALVRNALALSDAIWAGADPEGAYGKKIHHAEQFAMGYALRNCRLSEASDCVYHYWLPALKRSFETVLPRLVQSGLADRSSANLARLYAQRPRDTGSDAIKDSLKMPLRRLALSVGLPLKGVRRSIR